MDFDKTRLRVPLNAQPRITSAEPVEAGRGCVALDRRTIRKQIYRSDPLTALWKTNVPTDQDSMSASFIIPGAAQGQ